MEWKGQQCGSADPDTPEHDHPLQVVQKTMASIGWLALHRQIPTGFFMVRAKLGSLEREQTRRAQHALTLPKYYGSFAKDTP